MLRPEVCQKMKEELESWISKAVPIYRQITGEDPIFQVKIIPHLKRALIFLSEKEILVVEIPNNYHLTVGFFYPPVRHEDDNLIWWETVKVRRKDEYDLERREMPIFISFHAFLVSHMNPFIQSLYGSDFSYQVGLSDSIPIATFLARYDPAMPKLPIIDLRFSFHYDKGMIDFTVFVGRDLDSRAEPYDFSFLLPISREKVKEFFNSFLICEV